MHFRSANSEFKKQKRRREGVISLKHCRLIQRRQHHHLVEAKRKLSQQIHIHNFKKRPIELGEKCK